MVLTIDFAQWLLLLLNVLWLGGFITLVFFVLWYFGVAVLMIRGRADLSALEYSAGGIWLVFAGWRNAVRYSLAFIACGVMLLAATLRRIIKLGVDDGLTHFIEQLEEADYGYVLNSALLNAKEEHAEEIGKLKEQVRVAENEAKRAKQKLTAVQKLSNLDGTLDQTRREMESYLQQLRNESGNGKQGNGSKKDNRNDNGRRSNNNKDDRRDDNYDDRRDRGFRDDDNTLTREFEPAQRNGKGRLPAPPVGRTFR